MQAQFQHLSEFTYVKEVLELKTSMPVKSMVAI
jgi:hypothetical protein